MKPLKSTLTILFIVLTTLSSYGQTALRERLEQHVYTLAADSLQGRKAGTQYAEKAAEYIVRQFEDIGIEPFFDTTFLQVFRDGDYRNVVGIIRGSDPNLTNEYLVIGAHYDHLGVKKGQIYSGADDNASGVAVLIELARKLHNDRANLNRNIVLIAFDAEEVGLIGSTYFVEHSGLPIEHIRLMMSLDMVGWYGTSGEVRYLGVGTIKGGREMFLNPQFVPTGLHVVTQNFERSMFTATDTRPFAIKGIPTLAVTTGTKSPYHKPEDEAHLIDYDGMVLITEHLQHLITAISQDMDYRSSGRLAKKHRPQPRVEFALSASTGTNHHHYTAGAVNGKKAMAFGAGLVSQVNFGAFAIRPEVHYDRIRAKHPEGMIATDNITVPVSLVLQALQDRTGMDLFFGGYYSHRLDGRQDKASLDFANTFNREEFGLTYGASLCVFPLKIGFTIRTALSDFTQQPNGVNAHLRNRTRYFTVTYVF